jgi:hypothetical protein
MAKYTSSDARLLVDGYDLSGYSTQVDIETRAATIDTTVLGDTWRTHATTLKEADISHEGFYDTAIDPGLVTIGGTGTAVVMLAGNTPGQKAVGLAGAMKGGYRRVATIGEYTKAKGEFSVTGLVEEGVVQEATSIHSGNTGAGSVVDNLGSSANGASCYLQETALTLGGFTNCTINVRHSATNGSFVNLATFANVSASAIDERITVAGTVNRYVTTYWTFNGSGSAPAITYACVVARNP